MGVKTRFLTTIPKGNMGIQEKCAFSLVFGKRLNIKAPQVFSLSMYTKEGVKFGACAKVSVS
jgi:hypothetical protein